jgi:hypothetical protein
MKKVLLSFLLYALVAAASAQEMQKAELYDKKVEIMVPAEFQQMSNEDIQKRFTRGTPPDIVFADKKGSPSISASLKDAPANQEKIAAYVDAIEKSIKTPMPQAETIEKGTNIINGKIVGYIAIITPAVNGDIYNYMFFTDLNNKLLVLNFSCMKRLLSEWSDSVKKISSSLKIN